VNKLICKWVNKCGKLGESMCFKSKPRKSDTSNKYKNKITHLPAKTTHNTAKFHKY
jgi:hypothetical protein